MGEGQELDQESEASAEMLAGESAEGFLARAAAAGCRVVSSGDLNEWQISSARSKGNFWVSAEGLGWAILPWELTTEKDRGRERAYLERFGQ